jgi:hypothetical protein
LLSWKKKKKKRNKKKRSKGQMFLNVAVELFFFFFISAKNKSAAVCFVRPPPNRLLLHVPECVCLPERQTVAIIKKLETLSARSRRCALFKIRFLLSLSRAAFLKRNQNTFAPLCTHRAAT